jgi:hypothetical protein
MVKTDISAISKMGRDVKLPHEFLSEYQRRPSKRSRQNWTSMRRADLSHSWRVLILILTGLSDIEHTESKNHLTINMGSTNPPFSGFQTTSSSSSRALE